MRPLAATVTVSVILAGASMVGACDQLERVDDGGGPAVPDAVQQAFDSSCAAAGCHAATTQAGQLSLAPGDSDAIIGRPALQSPTLPLVEVGNVCGSYLAIKLFSDVQLDACGATRNQGRMPVGGIADANTAQNVALIVGWVAGTEFPVEGGNGGDTDGIGARDGTDVFPPSGG